MPSDDVATELRERSAHDPIRRLRCTNGSLALAHATQAALMLALTNARSRPVTGAFGRAHTRRRSRLLRPSSRRATPHELTTRQPRSSRR